MINAVIIEDERHGLDNLKNLLSKYCPQVKVIGEAGSVETGIELFSSLKEKVNVAFLDINLPDGLVFQILNALPKRSLLLDTRSLLSKPVIIVL